MSNLIWYIFPALIIATLLVGFGGDTISRIHPLGRILKKKGASPVSTGEKKSADQVKKNGWKMLIVLIALLLATYIFLSTAPTQLPAWRWAFYLILSFLIAYGGNLGKWVGTAILLLVVIVGGWATVFGTNSVEQKFEYLRSVDSGDRSVFPQSTPRHTPICGPNVFIERRVTSTTVPARFEGRPTCRIFFWDRPRGLPLLIRYNGEGGYQLWPSNGSPPRSERVIRFAEVKLVNPGEAYISVFFPR